MKLFLVLCVAVSLLSGIRTEGEFDPELEVKYSQHYDQHQEVTSQAKKSAMERLQAQGVSEAAFTGSSGSASFTAGQEVDELGGAGFSGLGVVSYTGGSQGQASSSSAFSSEVVSQQQGQQIPILPLATGGNSEHFSSHSEQYSEDADAAAPLLISTGGSGASEQYSSHMERISETKAQPAPILIPTSTGGSEHYSSHSEHVSETAGEKFDTITQDGGGYVSRKDVGEALKTVGFDIPGYQLRELLQKYGDSDQISFEQLNKIYSSLLEERTETVNEWKRGIVRVNDAYQVQGIAEHGADEIVHTIRIAEEVAFSSWINDKLAADPDLKRLLPVQQDNGDLYKKVQDGLIICKLINIAQPDTIDERAINKKNLNTYTKLENLVLALTSCSAIGCNLVNIDADDISKGKPHLVLGIIWQIIRIGLFSQINLEQVPGMFRLLNEGETLDELRRLSPEQILIRWVNYHLANTNANRRMNNFTTDISDSTIYTYLLNQIAPKEAGLSLSPLNQQGNVKRASSMLNEAAKIDCRSFVTPNDVANGTYKLNLAFVANLFNKYPALPEPGADEMPEEDIVEETREEKTYRNWMNSLGVKPHVGYLFTDLQNGLIIFQLYEEIKKDVVNWKRVVKQFRKLQGMMDQIQNCNYAIELGRDLKFSLVGIQGKDIYDGNRTLTLALVWQLMRAYTLAVLARCTDNGNLATDKEIIRWVNEKLQSAGKSTQIRSFQDPVIADAIVVLDLIDAIRPGVINYEVVQRGGTDQERFDNAKYAITSGRKIGAIIYALPEDITEVNPKMVMTVFACLMARDYMPNVHIANNGSA